MVGNLDEFRVGQLPTVIYKPNFITEIEETHLLEKIYEAPLSKWKSLKNRRLQNLGGIVHEKGLLPQELPPWLTKTTKRISEESGLFPSAINHVLINEYLPDQGIMPHQDGPAYFPVVAILSLGSPVVMNFTPHSRLRTCTNICSSATDEKYFAGEAKEIETKKMDDLHPVPVLLIPRSLLIFKDNAYSDYLHGIEDSSVHQFDKAINEAKAIVDHDNEIKNFYGSESAVEVVRSGDLKVIHRTTNRVSLTCRLVPKGPPILLQKKLKDHWRIRSCKKLLVEIVLHAPEDYHQHWKKVSQEELNQESGLVCPKGLSQVIEICWHCSNP